MAGIFLTGCGPKPPDTSVLKVGMELSTPPFEMTDSAGKPDGIGVKIAEALAAKLGRKLDIQVMAFKGLETALKTGNIDVIISSMTDTEKRRESIDFSDPYCKIGLALLVANDSKVQNLADLNQPEKKIATRLGTTAVQFLKTECPQAQVVQLDSNAACLLEVTQKKADAFIYDQLSILKLHLSQPDQTKALLTPLRTDAWAIALQKGNGPLKQQINDFLKEFKASGGLEALGELYLKEEKAALKARGVPFVLE